MQQILITLPSIEQFVKAVVQEVLPTSSSSQLEDIIPKIQAWKRENLRLNQLRSEISSALGVSASVSDSALVTHNQLADCKSFELFKRLFSVGQRDDSSEAIEELYIFVHEVKDFVNKFREALRLSGDADTRQVLQAAYERVNRLR